MKAKGLEIFKPSNIKKKKKDARIMGSKITSLWLERRTWKNEKRILWKKQTGVLPM